MKWIKVNFNGKLFDFKSGESWEEEVDDDLPEDLLLPEEISALDCFLFFSVFKSE